MREHTTPGEDDGRHWSFDRRIPLALIFTMVAQFGLSVWWTSKLDSRVMQLEAEVNQTTTRQRETDRDSRGVEVRLARLEEKTVAILDILKSFQSLIIDNTKRSQNGTATPER